MQQINSVPVRYRRLEGLDLARFIALIGMVIVNFSIVMEADYKNSGLLEVLASGLQGRAAALFVILAGIGLGLAAARGQANEKKFFIIQSKRAGFLLVIGLLNMLIFPADILHYYAFYFAVGMVCIRWRSSALITIIVTLMAVFVVMVIFLDYDAGWDWDNYSYSGFWTLSGFVRNLFFNGWHPVIPWLAFLLWGILLARLDLYNTRIRLWLLLSHSLLFIMASLLSFWLTGLVSSYDAEAALLFSTEPIPPMPLYIMVGGGAAVVVIVLCLMLAPILKQLGFQAWFTRAGRQTLTLYVAHIYIGMGILEAFDMFDGRDMETVMLASLLFVIVSIFYAWIWHLFFKHGPLESLMRKLTT